VPLLSVLALFKDLIHRQAHIVIDAEPNLSESLIQNALNSATK